MSDYLSQKFRILSFVAIIAVVYVHAYNLQDRFLLPFTVVQDPLSATSFIELFISHGLTRFAVPIFFAISGYLFFFGFQPSPEAFVEKLLKRSRTLLLPYLLWSAIGLFLIWLVQLSDATRAMVDTWDVITPGVTLEQVLARWLLNPVPFQLWFVRDLMIYVLLSPALYALLRYLRFWPLLPLSLLWLVHANFRLIEAEGILFFSFGAYLAIHDIKLPEQVPARVPLICLMLWLVVLVGKTLLAFSGSPLLTGLYKLNVLLGVVTVWTGYEQLAETWQDNPGLLAAASLTTFIYFAHEPLLNFMTNLTLAHGDAIPPLTIYLLYPALTIGICAFVGSAFRMFLPPVYSLLTGGRGT